MLVFEIVKYSKMKDFTLYESGKNKDTPVTEIYTDVKYGIFLILCGPRRDEYITTNKNTY